MADWFALSSRFYADLDDEGVPEKSQTFLTRACGYMAEKETDGFLSDSAAAKLGLRQWKGRIPPLQDRRIMVRCDAPVADSMTTREQLDDQLADNSLTTRAPIPEQLRGREGWWFPAWEKWNGPLIAHVRKKKADRDRIAARRKTSEMSRDSSANVATHRTEQNRSTTYVGSSAHVADTHESNERPSGPPIQPTAAKLVRDIVPREYPSAVKADLRIRASELLNGGTDAGIVREALERWIAKSGVGPGILPSLVVDVIKERDPATHTRAAPGTTGGRQLTKRERQFIDLELQKDHPDPRVLAQYGLPPDTSSAALRAIPGGKA
ncbi:hypothetical protein PP483_gp66 [Gordonia phage Bunnybear]|uniref:Helix-turn-helix DNA binding domain protein n=1 Tax=Gordonia phage Bunnybear TaxID=2762398 RepID=A0A7G8LLK0_9CAUD|nr:hypothetical protein PP483_gp66 [Gordonia phage Bunnybear]QNJ58122.1 hypothetical protein SEA_BUNNYBEAR_66 [Gordonia phage Bunnybear]